MNRTVTMLVVLLLASNAAWWFTRSEAPAEANGGPGRSDPRPDPANDKVAGLEAELKQARARIEQLETTAQRAPAEARPARKPEDEAARAAREKRAEQMRRAQDLAKEWKEAVLQTADLGRRTQALDAIRTALMQGDAAEIQAALLALAGVAVVDYDKAAFHALVLPQLRSEDASVRAAALYALYNTNAQPEDRAEVLRMVGDPSPEVRSRLAHVVALNHKNVIEGEAADAVLRLMDDKDQQVRRTTLSGLWGTKIDTRVEDRFLALLVEPGQRHDAIYCGFSTFDPKSPRVVAVLLEALTDADPNIAQRALWGLSTGVQVESRQQVADAFLRLLASRSDPRMRSECLQMLQRYGSARHVPELEVLAAQPGANAAFRQQLEQVMTQLRRRS
jgi:hypothetical protein